VYLTNNYDNTWEVGCNYPKEQQYGVGYTSDASNYWWGASP